MLKTRVISALAVTIILILSLLGPKYMFTAFLLMTSLIAFDEYFRAVRINGRAFEILGSIFCILSIIFYKDLQITNFLLYLLLITSFLFVFIDYNNKKMQDIYLTMFGSILLGFCASFAQKLYYMEQGKTIIWILLISACTTDVFAFIFGSLFGKHKFSQISPKKSIEGSAAGFICCVIVIFIFGYFANSFGLYLSSYDYLALGMIGGTVGQLGDLAASLIKRWADIKDFGSIMPGHGGVIDRIDSMLFLAPAIYYYLYFFTNLSR